MDYNYIRLENQIKALINQNHVPSSTISKIAESLKNGTLELFIDTVQKRFVFKYIGINNPVSIDPLKKEILNVDLLNGVDVSNLVGGIQNGYGINIEEITKGVFKISVDETTIASKNDLSKVDEKFKDYTTTADLEANYATKNDLNNVDSKLDDYATKTELNGIDAKFSNYTTTADLEANYTTKTELNGVAEQVQGIDAKFFNYTTTTDLEANYMKKDDIIPPSESQFESVPGFPDYYVKNEHVSTRIDDSLSMGDFNILSISLPSEVKDQIFAAPDNVNIFKFVLRKKILYNTDGELLREFYAYREGGATKGPVLVSHNNSSTICITQHWSTFGPDFYIAFDTRLNVNPYTLYMNGELSIQYLLSQTALVAKEPTIKCDIIEAKNALKLYESDVRYFYKPSIIKEEKIGEIDYYKMVYKIPTDYTIPTNLNFTFTEYCFGNKWSMRWDGTKWDGYNCQGRSNGKIESSKQTFRVDKKYNDYGMSGCYVRCRHTDWNAKFLGGNDKNLMKKLFTQADRTETTLFYKDGTTERGRNIRMEIDYYKNVDPYSKEGYDYLPLFLRINNSDKNAVNELLNKTEKIYLDMIYGDIINRLTFRWGDLHQDEHYGFYIDLIGEIDSVEKINILWSAKELNIASQDIVLYLRKDYTDPIEEVNWDSTTNAFSYIIQQQFYEITPNPNAATTLYTDFNITSSKIITADNITTMRSDLNVISNNVDVMNVDVKDLRDNVETLNSEMAETKEITQHLQKDVKQNRIIAGVALAFGVLGTAGSVASIGMQLASNGIGFATKGGTTMLKNCAAEGMEHEMNVESVLHMSLPLEKYSLRAITTDLTPILTWCNEEYKAVSEIPFEEEYDDPKTKATSLYTTIDIANRFRDSLKPIFKKIANKVEEVSAEIENIDVSDQMTTLETKFNKKLKEYVNHDELVRDDEIDIFARVDQEHSVLLFEFEDNIVNGHIVYKIFSRPKAASTTA